MSFRGGPEDQGASYPNTRFILSLLMGFLASSIVWNLSICLIGHPTPPANFSKLETWNSYSLTAQNFKGENWIDTIIKQATPPLPK